MPRLLPQSSKNLVKVLKSLGFEGPFAGGKHPYIKNGFLYPISIKARISLQESSKRLLKKSDIRKKHRIELQSKTYYIKHFWHVEKIGTVK